MVQILFIIVVISWGWSRTNLQKHLDCHLPQVFGRCVIWYPPFTSTYNKKFQS